MRFRRCSYDLDQSGELDLKEFALVHLMLTRRAQKEAQSKGKRLPPSLAGFRSPAKRQGTPPRDARSPSAGQNSTGQELVLDGSMMLP